MTVNSSTVNADAQAEAVTNQHGNTLNPSPPAGFQYALLNVSFTNMGSVSQSIADFLNLNGSNSLAPEGLVLVERVGGTRPTRRWLAYPPTACEQPPLDLACDQVSPSQTVTGDFLFMIRSDATKRHAPLLVVQFKENPGIGFKIR